MSTLIGSVSKTYALKISAPEIFARRDFMEWLNYRGNSTATWHKKGFLPSEFSDAFVTVDSNFEGSDSDMPEDIWNVLCETVYRELFHGSTDLSFEIRVPVIVWLSPV